MPHEDFWRRNSSKKAQKEIATVASALGVDRRAINILFNSIFDQDDELMPWVNHCVTSIDVAKEDYALAKAARVMFDPVVIDHDALIAWIIEGREKLEPSAVSNAFVSSLGLRRFDARSVLGSYAHVLHLEQHEFKGGGHSSTCYICGADRAEIRIDRSARNFRRLKWAGNVEHCDLIYIGCDLELFGKQTAPKPTEADIEILRCVLDAIRGLSEKAQLGDLNKALIGLFKSDKNERQVVLEILGFAGVLKPAGLPSFFENWVRPADRPEPEHRYKREWLYPTNGWSGSDGVNEDAIAFWFPQLRQQ